MGAYLSAKHIIAAIVTVAALCCAHAQTSYYSKPGLIQAKFGAADGVTSGNANNNGNWNLIKAANIAGHGTAERVLGTFMADIQADESNYANADKTFTNPLTGNKWNWNYQYTGWGYTGQMWIEAGVTYTFGKSLDDAARIKVGGQIIFDNTTWNDWVTGTFTTNVTGWVDFDVRFYDGSGGKGPYGSWGPDIGLAFNTNTPPTTSITPKTSWTRLRDPGDGSLFRVAYAVASPTAPAFDSDVPMTLKLVGADFEVSAALAHGVADCFALAGYQGVYTATNQIATAATVGATVSGALANLATNTMYTAAVYAEDGLGANALVALPTPFYSGELQLAWVQDADEDGFVPGKVSVNRADTPEAKRLPLVVNYSFTGITAVEGTHYVKPSGTITIPAGETNAFINITPLVAMTGDTTLDVALLPGLYYHDPAAAVVVTIKKWTPNNSHNTWIASPLSDGLASTAGNWSLGVPQSTDHILLGAFSSQNMTWDAGVNNLPDTVASWTQEALYTGTVTFNTKYPETGAAFTNFHVAGNVLIENGVWTHQPNGASQVHRLCVSAGGNFTLATANARIDLRQKGFSAGNSPGGQVGIHAGGRSSWNATYGCPYEPRDLGAGGGSLAGGGALWLVAGGDVVINSLLRADSTEHNNAWGTYGAGAGGSVYIKAASLSGTGHISANALGTPPGVTTADTDAHASVPSGGRIAIVVAAPSLGLPVANITALGTTGPESTGAGTILVKTSGQKKGTLYVKTRGRHNRDGFKRVTEFGTTIIPPGANWEFDAIVTSEHGILSVPPGATLTLPNGFASVSGSSYFSGILHYGGAYDFGACPDPWVFSTNWTFHAAAPLTITGNVKVIHNGAIGLLRLDNSNKTSWHKMNLTVDGNLFVDSTSWINARSSGFDYCIPNASTVPSATVPQSNAHGGQQGDALNASYGSILNPVMPGASGWIGDRSRVTAGGGAVMLTVTGELKLDGIAESTGDWPGRGPGWNDEANVGPGGSINITAGSLIGNGQIRAHGIERSYNGGASQNFWGHNGGGRIAVRLTGQGSGFDVFKPSQITAKGGSRANELGTNGEALQKDPTGASATNRFSSAGTIYLQTASQAEGAGDIIIRNDNNPLNQIPVTVIPALTYGGLDDDLSKASLFIEDCARVKLAASFQLVAFRSQPGTNLDLNGKTLAVSYCTLGGKPLIQKGAFSAAQLLDMGFAGVTDTSLEQTGLLEIKPFPTLFIVR